VEAGSATELKQDLQLITAYMLNSHAQHAEMLKHSESTHVKHTCSAFVACYPHQDLKVETEAKPRYKEPGSAKAEGAVTTSK